MTDNIIAEVSNELRGSEVSGEIIEFQDLFEADDPLAYFGLEMEEGNHNVPVNSITDELERYRNISFADFRSLFKRQKDKKADLPALARGF